MRYVLLAIGSLLTVALDQISKLWALKTLLIGELPPDGLIRTKNQVVIDGCFHFKLAGNKGAAWGLFRSLPEDWRVPFFVLISVIAVGVILYLYRRTKGNKLESIALTLILGGALGNLVDRIRLGFVIDFIDWFYGNHHWPTFNIADVWITVGVGLLLIDLLFHHKPKSQDVTD